ncbi:hypothetical protein GCM10025791_00080 [Halioxenophilus aromaticivorans]|uniref:Uncharacterized protein n=1 Tax=Halioxenophilus aromaticivorans TaxID=1306992 RepID=A0AAV3TW43_9ALTE
MQSAGEIVKNGGHAFLQVEASPLLGRGDDREHYDHWLPLTCEPVFYEDKITFATYSWGQQRCIDISVETFCDSFHGVVVASR